MATSSERWIDGLQFFSFLWPPPRDPQQHKDQVVAYVKYFGQFTSEKFPNNIAQLITRADDTEEMVKARLRIYSKTGLNQIVVGNVEDCREMFEGSAQTRITQFSSTNQIGNPVAYKLANKLISHDACCSPMTRMQVKKWTRWSSQNLILDFCDIFKDICH